MLTETAYAKINLALHIRRRRADGYHDIETVFAFCVDGDFLTVNQAAEVSLSVSGPFADGLSTGADNLVSRAVDVFRATFEVHGAQSISLNKQLPVAAGIGGGSADAAAALRALAKIYGKQERAALNLCAASLGADVPACLASCTARADGIGQHLTEEASVTGTPVLLVNPRVALSTAQVFAGWDGTDRGPLCAWQTGRNDLETPARKLVPAIGYVLDWLVTQPGTTLIRMSGSGATCFALFEDVDARDRTVAAASRDHPHWWLMASTLR